MARPKTPLISRRAALEAALKIVDNEGLDALSIRRLGDALNVNGASLYHHFKNKEDILIGVTQLALEDVTAPRSETESWRSWLPTNAERTRQVLIAHPGLIPLMLERSKLGIGARELGASAQRMEAEGVPVGAIAPLIHSLELLAILCALQEINAEERAAERPRKTESEEVEALNRAEAASSLEGDELFQALVNSAMAAIETTARLKSVHEGSSKSSLRPRAGRGTKRNPAAAGRSQKVASAG
jgi:TetR/AcrR family tetracycline transcriptional repressor